MGNYSWFSLVLNSNRKLLLECFTNLRDFPFFSHLMLCFHGNLSLEDISPAYSQFALVLNVLVTACCQYGFIILYHHVFLNVISWFFFFSLIELGEIRDVFQCRRFNIYELPRYVTIIVILHGLVELICYLYWFLIFLFVIWILKGVDKLASFVSHVFMSPSYFDLDIILTFTHIIVNHTNRWNEVWNKEFYGRYFFWPRWV